MTPLQAGLSFWMAWYGFLLSGAQAMVMSFSSTNDDSSSFQKRVLQTCENNSTRMPVGSWDSHHHVMDPNRYPPLPDAEYEPGVYTAWNHVIFEHKIGFDHSVLVQPSIYGYNNSMMIDTLKAYGPERARAVVMFNTTNTTEAQLQEWDNLGVRGVRLNFQSTGEEPPANELKEMLKGYADVVRPFGWVIQLYIAMDAIPLIEDVVPTLGVKVVFDHFGVPDIPEEQSDDYESIDPYSLDGFDSMVRLLRQGSSWVKISGAYRLSNLPGPTYRDIDPLVRELLRVVPSNLVYGSDWPHTRFDGLDIKPWTEHLLDLTRGNDDLRDRLFRDNAEDLWSGRPLQ